MQGTFFSQRRPNYINYGSYGALVGHPIASSLIQLSKQKKIVHNLTQFWDSNQQEVYQNTTICGDMPSGVDSDSFADLIAVKAAYLAYKDWAKRHYDESDLPFIKFSPLQNFWIAMAQNHCMKIDENGEFSNSITNI